jgi:WD40 repeat protein
VAATVIGAATALDAAIVRLRDRNGRVVGAGVLVGAREILTCTHVVARALHEPGAQALTSEAEVRLDFPLLASTTTLTATVIVWQEPGSEQDRDITGLRLAEAPPDGARPVRLVATDDVWGHPFRTFGFPARHDDGVWATGLLRGRQATGWVQLDGVTTTGFRIEPGFSGAPVWDDELGGVVGIAVAAEARPDLRAAYLAPTGLILAAWPALGAQALPPCPYRGLFAFREQDAPLFFGREELADQVANQLAGRPLTAVVGPSGSGKSSLVLAGIVPRLRRWEGWIAADLRPGRGASPLAALASALLPFLEPDMTETQRLQEIQALAAILAQERLAEVAERAVQRVGAHRLLLIVDQAEELYERGSAEAWRFLDVLLGAVAVQDAQRSTLALLIALRADFLGQALEHARLAAALQRSVVVIGRMTREQLRSAIEGPARDVVTYEAGLVDRILDDVGAEPGNLPLLEFALTLLWERQDNRTLTHAAYEALGGVRGALARYAEQVYLDLPEQERQDARRVFVQLVRPGETTEATRRLASRADLDDGGWRVAQRLATARLVVTGRDPAAADTETVDVAHEALIFGWDRLRQWVEADRAFRVWQERLRAGVRQWLDGAHDEGALLRGTLLAEGERWLHERHGDISPTEKAFIEASRSLRDRQLELAGRRNRQLRAFVASLSALLVVAVTAGVLAVQRGRRVDHERVLTLSRQLAAQAAILADSQPELAALLSVEAYKTAPTLEARGNLLNQAARLQAVAGFLHNPTAGKFSGRIALSPTGGTMAWGGDDGSISLWDVDRRVRLATMRGHTGTALSLAFSRDGRLLASGGLHDGTVIVWDVAHRQRISALRGPPPPHKHESQPVDNVAFSPDGRVVAAGLGYPASVVILWDVATRTRLATLPSKGVGLTSMALSPNGRTLAMTEGGDVGSQDISLWSVVRHGRLVSFRGPEAKLKTSFRDLVTTLAFSPNGRLLAAAGNDSTIIMWDAVRHRRYGLPLSADAGAVLDISFSPDGRILASGNEDHSINLWDPVHGVHLRELAEHTEEISGVAFSGDGRTLTSSSNDGTAIVWHVASLGLNGYGHAIHNLVFTKDGKTLVSDGDDYVVRLWDAARPTRSATALKAPDDVIDSYPHDRGGQTLALSADGRVLAWAGGVLLWDAVHRRALPPLSTAIVSGSTTSYEGVSSVAVAPNGRFVAGASHNGSLTADSFVFFWDLEQRTRVQVRPGTKSDMESMAFSPDGRTLAIATDDNTIILLDALRHNRIGTLKGHTDWVTSVAFSPDGRTLASGSRDHTVILWDVSRRSRINAPMIGHTDVVASVAFSPDGRTLASGSRDHTVILWDVRDSPASRLATLRGHADGVNTVAFSPDGRRLASGSNDTTIMLWPLDAESGASQLCGALGRSLTQAEWAQFVPGRKYHRTCG